MSDDLKARPQGRDRSGACDRLVARAADAVSDGDPDRAIEALVEAHGLHLQASRLADASHCVCQAATIARMGGALERATELAEHAQKLAGDDDQRYRAAAIELSEVELLRERPARAAEHLHRARERAGDASVELRIAMAMKHAESLHRAGESLAAEDAWVSAESMAQQSAQLAVLLVRRASLLLESKSRVADAAIVRAKLVAQSADDRRALADVAMLECASALAQGELDVAMRAAEIAREHALACQAVMVYVSAAAILARLHDTLGDRVQAYRSLAVGWVTVSELLGSELARASFAPLLTDFRSSWGEAGFAEAKALVEAG